MSWHYLQGAEEESWEGSCLDGAPDALLSLMPTQEKSCLRDSGTESLNHSRSGTMLPHLTEDLGGDTLTLSQEDSHVKTFPSQVKEKESQGKDRVFGLTWPESLPKYNPNTALWKTAQCSLFGGLTECSLTLPKWGTMLNGELSERTMPEHLTKEIGSGYWPTADANMGARGTQPEWKPIRKSGHPAQYTINQAVRDQEFWPTPTVCGNHNKKGLSATSGDGLATVVKKQWPTPCTRDYKGAHTKAGLIRKDGKSRLDQLPNAVMYGGTTTPQTAPLNPDWVEWLMGWPIGWTDLKPLGMDKFQSVQHTPFNYWLEVNKCHLKSLIENGTTCMGNIKRKGF